MNTPALGRDMVSRKGSRVDTLVWIMLLCGALNFGSGCVTWRNEVSGSQAAWGGYNPSVQYELLHDVYLMVAENDAVDLCIVPDQLFWDPSRIYSPPDVVELTGASGRAPAENTVGFKGIVAKGTRIRVKKVSLLRGVNWWSGLQHDLVYCGEIVSGVHTGKIVDLHDVSVFYYGSKGFRGGTLLQPDERLLKVIEAGGN